MTDVRQTYLDQIDALKTTTLDGLEVWSARDMVEVAGYAAWQDFRRAIDRAILSTRNSGSDPDEHFRSAHKVVTIGSGAKRQIEDFEMTRYGCYILFLNGDIRKPEIAAAQQYFAVQTRKQELAPSVPLDPTSLEGAAAILAAAQVYMERVKELEPKAEAWDDLAGAKGDYSVGDAAKMLNRAGILTGPQRLFEQLAGLHWTFRAPDGRWRAYQNVVDMGYLTEKPMTHHHPRTGEVIIDPPQIRVTINGLDRLRRRLASPVHAVEA